MKEFQHRNMMHVILYSKASVVVLLLVCLLLLRSIVELNEKRQKVGEDQDKVHKEKFTLEAKVTNAQKNLEFIKTERGKEEYIRNTYPVVKEGEGVIVVYNASTSPVAEVKKDEGMWKRFIVWIKEF